MDPDMGEIEPDVDENPHHAHPDVNDLFGFVNQSGMSAPKPVLGASSADLSFFGHQPMATPSGWVLPPTPGMFAPQTPMGGSAFAFGASTPSSSAFPGGPLFGSSMVSPMGTSMTGAFPGSSQVFPQGHASASSPSSSSSSVGGDMAGGFAGFSSSTLQPVSASQMMHAQPAQQTAQQILGTIYTLMTEQEDKLKKMCTEQLELLRNPQMEPFNNLVAQQRLLKEQMDIELRSLMELNQKVILDPPDLARMYLLTTELQLQMRQLELYHAELQQLLGQSSAACIAALVIKKQPFPIVISKLKQLNDDQLTVYMLTGAYPNFQIMSSVKATLICDTHNPSSSKSGGPANPLDCDSQAISLQNKVATFPLKFMQGTRKASVNIKFGVSVRSTGGTPATIESNMSNPFVVITNECQWEGSAGTLLKKDAFGGSLEIPWPQFVNALQRHFLLATKQDPVRPKRPLSVYDFQYINTQFFGSRSIIHQKDYDAFWGWFGKSMQTLRYQRHICNLWQNGIIYGYMGRDDVNAALNNQEPGTFIIRFSERNPGQFGIAYTGTELPTRIKHYLVQANDTAAARRTFPDFLSDCGQFVYLLQLTHDPATGRPLFTKSHKDIALEPYAARKASQTPVGGYEPLTA
eukprot:TRINITY_DN5930_c0_g1_i3.p1 TRINITY_DN5930_c0_g1~~TRINITY_DN5930_c0_g1_i3.p1  ORF type:complete len:634 (-),score=194.11 TRINITY_DN5930_c0_g1_i3:203-2104(-)